MRGATRFSTALALLALVCMFPIVSSANHDSSAQESRWVGSLYGSTELWGLGYNIPWARSAHHITVSNEGIGVGQYLYEFKISVPEANLESKHPTNPQLTDIVNGDTVMIPGHMNLDLRRAHNIADGQQFTLSCYTRLTIRKGGGQEQWRVTLEHRYMK